MSSSFPPQTTTTTSFVNTTTPQQYPDDSMYLTSWWLAATVSILAFVALLLSFCVCRCVRTIFERYCCKCCTCNPCAFFTCGFCCNDAVDEAATEIDYAECSSEESRNRDHVAASINQSKKELERQQRQNAGGYYEAKSMKSFGGAHSPDQLKHFQRRGGQEVVEEHLSGSPSANESPRNIRPGTKNYNNNTKHDADDSARSGRSEDVNYNIYEEGDEAGESHGYA